MHWSEKIAQEIIRRDPNKEEYVCAAGISPSGSIHIGNFRDVATSYFVVKALRKQGKKARLLFSWDEYDRMRKVPVNVAKVRDDFEQYIGYPYVDVPNPFPESGAKTYAEHFEKEFIAAMQEFGIEMDYRYQGEMNRGGKYVDLVLTSLRKRGEIFDILDSFRTQDAQEGEREAYYPVSIYCPKCHRDTTKILSLSDDCVHATYECACGYKGEMDFTKDFHCKLAWKVDWAARWMYEGVDFEPGGKDHASPTGSYQTSKVISKKIFGYEPPLFQGYEFIGIRGTTGKMSGSSGLNLTPGTLLKLYQPEVILWLYSKTEPTHAFDFCFDDGILKQYFEFDRMLDAERSGKADEVVKGILYNCKVEGREVKTVPMSLIVQMGSIVDFNPEMLETVFQKIGTPYTREEFADRLDRAKFWLEQCAPDQVNRLEPHRNWAVYETLDEKEKEEVHLLHEYLSGDGYTLDELNTAIYAIPAKVYGVEQGSKELRPLQTVFFQNVYKLLIGREKGPRLYLFLYAIEKSRYLGLLDFSYPMTEEEKARPEEPAEEEKPEKVYGEPDPVAPVKDEIDIDLFEKLDLRVCKIVKCQEIRKSANCLKLTLDDGLGQRVIVSSIRHDYTPEELIGKKIIVVANLKPARITGVTSQGMLLAGTNNACGCKVIFVDDAIPEGTAIK
ncbi:MAG: lysine--tRNA ligase [Oscillospiraceae bacterium]|nr:lysine--tRNA ligase [Oscillospiraceae bacterium]